MPVPPSPDGESVVPASVPGGAVPGIPPSVPGDVAPAVPG